MDMNNENKKNGKRKLISFALSILAAGVGIQSDKNREHDFANGSPLAFVVGGIIFTLLFIVSVATIVGLVLSNS
jgi:hypothetical protein